MILNYEQAGQAGTPTAMDATVHQMAALNSMFNMAQLFNMAQQTTPSTTGFPNLPALGSLGQLPLNGNFDLSSFFGNATSEKPTPSTPTPSISQDKPIPTPKTGVAFRKALENYGFDQLSPYIDDLEHQKKKVDKLADGVIAELAKVECKQCQRGFSNIWVLKVHCEEAHSGRIPEESIQEFAGKLRTVLDSLEVKPNLKRSTSGSLARETEEPEAKKVKEESSGNHSGRSSATPKNSKKNDSQQMDLSQLAMMSMMAGFPFMGASNPFAAMMTPEMVQTMAASMSSLLPGSAGGSTAMPLPNLPASVTPTGFGNSSNSPQKRARTRITDDQLKILRQYFDINNSPSEQQIKEMSIKAQLPEKVIKHWFRNTLFKERQRDKDSPYNFNVPPQMSIDLDTYEKTGEARILPLKQEEEDAAKAQEENKEIQQNEAILSSAKSSSCTPDILHSQPNNVETESTASNANSAVADFMANFNKAAAAAAMGGMGGYPGLMNPFASFMPDDKTLTSMLTGISASTTPTLPTGPSLASSSGVTGTMTGRRANRTRFTDFQLRTLQQFFDKQAYPKDDDLEMLSKKLNLSPRVIVVWFQNARQKARKIYENQPNQDSNERFVRTPGCNFQCKRCNLVFQRYYELIQHQQKVCYINDDEGQQTDNKSVEENLDDDEKSIWDQTQTSNQGEQNAVGGNTEFTIEAALAHLTNGNSGENEPKSDDLFKLIASSKASSEAMLKMLKTREKKRAFYKRCPFCGLLFHAKEKLVDHIQGRHKDQPLAVQLDVDLIPDAEDVPTITTNDNEANGQTEFSPLDLSCSGDQPPFSPTISHSDNGEDGSGEDLYFRPTSSSPMSNFLQAPGSVPGSIAAQRSPTQNSKRYRTHLTPLQVYVMKSLFNDYKTPSMTECDILGSHIGLNKRVVQVWFQNARAKERKARASSSTEEDQPKSSATSCSLCNVEFNSRTTLQDHIFTAGHIAQIKETAGAQIRGNGDVSPSHMESIPVEETRPRAKAVRDTKKPVAATNGAVSQGNGRSGLSSPNLGTTMNQFPYNLMYGLQSASALPMICDPNVIGTPIPMLQISQAVMSKIATDLNDGLSSTTFTQDGLEFQELVSKVHADDFRCVRTTETEVGWACPKCTNVFQQESYLKNHQKLICHDCEGIFKLIQVHYECVPCSIKFGTQEEYRTHCDTLPHKTARTLLNPSVTSILA